MKLTTRRVLVPAVLGLAAGVTAGWLVSRARRQVDRPSDTSVSSPRSSANTTPVVAIPHVSAQNDAQAPHGRARRFSKRRLLAAAAAACLITSGLATTDAAFLGQTRNPGNSFATGTLVLANTKQGGSACLSTAGGTTDTNVNNSCDQLIGVSVRKPGDTAVGKVTVRNNGSINGTALQFYLSNCATSNAPGEIYNGSANMCSGLQVYVQEYSDAAFTTKSSCLYGGGTATVCAYDGTKTLTTLAAAYTSGAPLGLGPLAAGSSEYYEIALLLPTSADNTFQGRRATFDLTWILTA